MNTTDAYNAILETQSQSLTESVNPNTIDIDIVPTLTLVQLINDEDKKVALAIEAELPQIAAAIDAIAERMQRGGRLIYMGAGTSGRLGVLDASEMPPTYSVPQGRVIGLIAGGLSALTNSIEGAEDEPEQGRADMLALQPMPEDTLVGLAASGSTPYVVGALKAARGLGLLTISIACNRPAPVHDAAEITIAPLVGPEVISGSTRMKAGSAQKMVLNMISTGVMIRLGKTYGNLMVDVQASNTKLVARAKRIVAQATGLSLDEAAVLLDRCESEVKTAIVVALTQAQPDVARQWLAQVGGVVREAIGLSRADPPTYNKTSYS